MQNLETDYLVIGVGAVGMAFTDTLLAESSAEVILADRRGKPGGHWNDAYSFVTLHQPSAFYGVASLPLGGGQIDRVGPNRGCYELASGAEVSGYFDRVMQQQLLPTGRALYKPMHDYRYQDGDHILRSLLTGEETRVTVRRRVVDATYYGTTIPATHTPRFEVAAGAAVVPPNALPGLWQGKLARPSHYVILGAGKTAMDVALWLLQCGTPEGQIHWVMPRDSWLINRRTTQPSMDFFDEVMGAQVVQMEALAECATAEAVFERLEAAGAMLRIDRSQQPSMFHYATMAEGEVEQLRRISQVLRQGRVLKVEPQALVFEQEPAREEARVRVPVPAGSLFIDCTATAVERRPVVPVFQPGRIVLQMVRVPQPAFSAALVAHLEARGLDDGDDSDTLRNALTTPIPLPDGLDQYPRASMVGLWNQALWGRDKSLREWIRQTRLDGFGKLLAQVSPEDAARGALLARLGAASKALQSAGLRWMQ